MELDGEQVALPASDGLTARTFIILKNSGPYLRSHLAGLGAVLELRWRCNLGTPEQAAEHLAGLDFSRDGNEFVFSGMPKYGPLVTILRKYCRRFSADVDPLQETVTVRMGEEWGVHVEGQVSSTSAIVPDAPWEDASFLGGESE